MKTLPLLLLTAIVAFIFLPVRFEIGMSLLAIAGLGTVLFGDYARFKHLPPLDAGAAKPSKVTLPQSALGLAA